jgi:hypothetical protein
MPITSKAQQRFMFAHQHDQGQLGDVAQDFISKTPKSAYASLPPYMSNGQPSQTGNPQDQRAKVLANMMKIQQ